MTYYHNPDVTKAHVVIFYRNFKRNKDAGGYKHIGLGVNGTHTAKVLREMGIRADISGVWTIKDIREDLVIKFPNATHVIIEAPWLSVEETVALCNAHPDKHFVVRCHSQVGFLQVEPGAVKILRELLAYQEMTLNLTVSGNSHRFCDSIDDTYHQNCLYLPNMYDVPREMEHHSPPHDHRVVRIASFGAIRLMKNHPTAAVAALQIARARHCDLEFFMSVDRVEGGGQSVIQTVKNFMDGLHWAKLVPVPWSDWSQFRHLVANMDLTLQLSSSETFNLVTADSLAAGVPAVVGPAIEWVPEHFKANIDDTNDVARVGSALLSDAHAPREGRRALDKYLTESKEVWLEWLKGQPAKKQRR